MSVTDNMAKDFKNPKLLGQDKNGKTFIVGRDYGQRLAHEGKIRILADQARGDNFTGIQGNDK
jgi:hypothetical protein